MSGFLNALITLLHILGCIALMTAILLQSGRGGGLAGTFGAGSSQTLFGGRGAATFLSRAATMLAVIFFLTSLTLGLSASRRQGPTARSLIQEEARQRAAQVGATQPGAPAPGASAPGQGSPTGAGAAPTSPPQAPSATQATPSRSAAPSLTPSTSPTEGPAAQPPASAPSSPTQQAPSSSAPSTPGETPATPEQPGGTSEGSGTP